MPRFAAEPLFADRAEAGERLAVPVGEVVAGRPAVVLAIPRGGVEVGAVLARRLDAPLDVVVPRKIGAPGNPELGLGAVADEVEVIDRRLIRRLRVSAGYLEAEILAQRAEIARRLHAYRGERPPLEPTGRVAVVVDDGVATGGTAVAALRWARAHDAAEVVLAVPVAPSEALLRLSAEADRVVVLASPEPFFAVGQWYASFPQTDDRRVVELLDAAGSR